MSGEKRKEEKRNTVSHNAMETEGEKCQEVKEGEETNEAEAHDPEMQCYFFLENKSF